MSFGYINNIVVMLLFKLNYEEQTNKRERKTKEKIVNKQEYTI